MKMKVPVDENNLERVKNSSKEKNAHCVSRAATHGGGGAWLPCSDYWSHPELVSCMHPSIQNAVLV